MLEKKFPVRNGQDGKKGYFVLPDDLAKRENRESAIEFCREKGLEYAIVDGTPRAVPPESVDFLIKFCTSYIREDGLRHSFGRVQPDKEGGINFRHLLGAVMSGDHRAISFARICANQNFKNIRSKRMRELHI